MHVKLRKWGNSAAVRIPAATLAAANLRVDDPVEVREEGGRIVIEPVRVPAPSLQDLLGGITDENLHDERDWGAAVGREIW